MSLPPFVADLDEAYRNVAIYAAAAKKNKLLDNMAYVRHWYAIEDRGTWSFAPASFIAFSNPSDRIRSGARGVLGGRESERYLEQWFVELPAGHPLESEIMKHLRQFVAGHGKSLNARARIHVPKARLPAGREKADAAREHTSRITSNPAILGGKPCIRGLRIRVSDILDMLAGGASRAEILDDYPYLEDADISAALAFAASAVDHRLIRAA